jgi:hypothetical protein
MGISLAWVAVKGLEPDTILARLALAPTGRNCDILETDIAAHPLPGDAHMVAALDCAHRIVRADSMASLSAGCQALACAVEEHVNFALCELWQDGRRLWQVQYIGSEDPEEFSHEGELPPRFHELLAKVTPEDSEDPDGYYLMDIPLILAKEFSGFHYGENDPAFDAIPFQELKDLRAMTKTGWWKRLWA